MEHANVKRNWVVIQIVMIVDKLAQRKMVWRFAHTFVTTVNMGTNCRQKRSASKTKTTLIFVSGFIKMEMFAM